MLRNATTVRSRRRRPRLPFKSVKSLKIDKSGCLLLRAPPEGGNSTEKKNIKKLGKEVKGNIDRLALIRDLGPAESCVTLNLAIIGSGVVPLRFLRVWVLGSIKYFKNRTR